MGQCSGNCASCSGCARELVLSEGEIAILRELGQFAFLPVARTLADGTPINPEAENQQTGSLLLQILEKKGLISLDYDKPLAGCDYGSYPIRGSMALTQTGLALAEKILERHTVLSRLLMKQGVSQETAEADACKMEHAISDESFQAIKRYTSDLIQES